MNLPKVISTNMIKLSEKAELPSVNFTDGFSVTKIKSNLLAYGCGYDFLRLWHQTDDNGNLTALIEKFENTLFISANPSADMDEIKEFITVTGYSSIQAAPHILAQLGLDFTEYEVLVYNGNLRGEFPPYPNIKEVYSLLYGEENQHIKRTDYQGFYADLSHKIRKGVAAAVTLEKKAVCVASHITEDSAVISGVAVQKASRESGLGSEVLSEMLRALGRRKIFVAAEKPVAPFYIKNGFERQFKTAIFDTEEFKLC